VTLVKSITWFAVIALVVVEIVVSVKTDGMPFDFSKISMRNNVDDSVVNVKSSVESSP